jgi:hypothetical protein
VASSPGSFLSPLFQKINATDTDKNSFLGGGSIEVGALVCQTIGKKHFKEIMLEDGFQVLKLERGVTLNMLLP